MINADYTLRNVLNSQNSFHLKVLNDNKTMMARNCRYFVLWWNSSRRRHDPSSWRMFDQGGLSSSPSFIFGIRDRQSVTIPGLSWPTVPAQTDRQKHQANLIVRFRLEAIYKRCPFQCKELIQRREPHTELDRPAPPLVTDRSLISHVLPSYYW